MEIIREVLSSLTSLDVNFISSLIVLIVPLVLKLREDSTFKERREKKLLKLQQRLYRQSLESYREEDPNLHLDGSSLSLRGLFYADDLLRRRCPRRKANYLEQLRHYRLFTLEWSNERAAHEARIGKKTYTRVEGLAFKERPHKGTVASICAAFEADAEQLGFSQYYLENELAEINLQARKLRLMWFNESGGKRDEPSKRQLAHQNGWRQG